MADYDSEIEGKCIFCEIAKGNMKPMGEGLIYEDECYMAWLSPFPNTEGFTVVIPKAHFGSDVLKMPYEKFHEFMEVSKKVAGVLEEYFDDVGRVGVIMEGTGVDHAHIKLFPMHGTGEEWVQFHSDNDRYFEKYEGYISSHDGPKADFDELKKLARYIRQRFK